MPTEFHRRIPLGELLELLRKGTDLSVAEARELFEQRIVYAVDSASIGSWEHWDFGITGWGGLFTAVATAAERGVVLVRATSARHVVIIDYYTIITAVAMNVFAGVRNQPDLAVTASANPSPVRREVRRDELVNSVQGLEIEVGSAASGLITNVGQLDLMNNVARQEGLGTPIVLALAQTPANDADFLMFGGTDNTSFIAGIGGYVIEVPSRT